MRRPSDFPLVQVVIFAGTVLLGWAAIQAWVLDSPVYAISTAIGTVIGGLLSYFFFSWLKKKKDQPPT